MNRIGIIIVDHGSRSPQSNEQLEEVARRFTQRYAGDSLIVEPAHMELALPTVAQAYERCVRRGADDVLVCPFFLAEGKHWQDDIPRLAAEAAARFPQTRWRATAPLGVDDLIVALLAKRVQEAAVAAMAEGSLSFAT